MSNEPLRHSAPANSSKPDARSAYNPVTLQDVQAKPESPLFEGLESTSSRTVAGLLFAVIFLVSRELLELSGLLVILLLVCVLYRMDARERQIAAIPLVFATTRIGICLSMQFHRGSVSPASLGSNNEGLLGSLHWMPLLFAAYLFYSPWKTSSTSRVVFWYSISLLLSGLLPGDGYLYIAGMLFYSLFIAIGIALIIDFSSDGFAERKSARPLAPHQPAQPAQPAFS
jgi:hypothetical protein